MTLCHGVHSIYFANQHLESVEGGMGIVEVLPKYMMVHGMEHVNNVVESFLRTESLLVLLVAYFILGNRLLHTFGLFCFSKQTRGCNRSFVAAPHTQR